MDKTTVDDMLIEMITPKVREIEDKFSRGDGLTQEDINTLLLKSQYNHINHLDLKLNEVTASVIALEERFDGKFNEMEGRFNQLEKRFEGKFTEMEHRFTSKFTELEHRFDKKFGEMENRFVAMEGRIDVLETKFDLFKAEMLAKFEQSHSRIQQTIISTMKWYIGGAGAVLVLLKAMELWLA